MLPLCIAMTVLLGNLWTWYAVNQPPGYFAAIRDPAAWDGETVTITLFMVEEITDPRHYTLRKGDRTAYVEGDTSELYVGQDLSVGGTFRAADSRIVAQWHEVHPLRDGKRAEGLAGVLVTVLLAPVWLAVRDNRLVQRA
jgi:hypothetical protein